MNSDMDIEAELASLDAKVNAFLPPRYQHCYESISPTSMGSAGLIYDSDGKVAWDRIWTTFCDLALAGGPPHRGKLLEPVSAAEVAAAPVRYEEVVAELRRAINMTTVLDVVTGYAPGWIGIQCDSLEEAGWLQFALTAENVSARRRGTVLQLPAGPAFRIEKEIKNVLVSLIKTTHYWDGHLSKSQQSLAQSDDWEPASPSEAAANPADYEEAMSQIESGLRSAGLPTSARRYTGWVGMETASEEQAGWLLRAVLVERILARREENVLYLPVAATPSAYRTAHFCRVLSHAWNLWTLDSKRR